MQAITTVLRCWGFGVSLGLLADAGHHNPCSHRWWRIRLSCLETGQKEKEKSKKQKARCPSLDRSKHVVSPPHGSVPPLRPTQAASALLAGEDALLSSSVLRLLERCINPCLRLCHPPPSHCSAATSSPWFKPPVPYVLTAVIAPYGSFAFFTSFEINVGLRHEVMLSPSPARFAFSFSKAREAFCSICCGLS